MTLRLNGSTSGYVEIDAPDEAGSNTLTLPDGNGTANYSLVNDGSGNLSWFNGGPAFSAYLSSQTTISSSTFVKVPAGTEEFDTASCYDTSNYRFTPNVAGYYQFSGIMFAAASTSITRSIIAFYKNGTSKVRGYDLAYNRGGSTAITTSSHLIYLNGSTDYVELFVYFDASGTLTLGGNDTNTCYFQAHLARPA
jgi:hypothetical protein